MQVPSESLNTFTWGGTRFLGAVINIDAFALHRGYTCSSMGTSQAGSFQGPAGWPSRSAPGEPPGIECLAEVMRSCGGVLNYSRNGRNLSTNAP